MKRQGQYRQVTLEYTVVCRRCQQEIPPGLPHHVVDVHEHGTTTYWHGHDECPKREPEPAKPNDPDGLSDGEALAMMGATFLVASASYLLGRWRQQRVRKG